MTNKIACITFWSLQVTWRLHSCGSERNYLPQSLFISFVKLSMMNKICMYYLITLEWYAEYIPVVLRDWCYSYFASCTMKISYNPTLSGRFAVLDVLTFLKKALKWSLFSCLEDIVERLKDTWAIIFLWFRVHCYFLHFTKLISKFPTRP